MSLGAGRLEQLDDVAGRVFQQNLLAARAGDNIVPEGNARGTQPLHLGRDIAHYEVNAVPSAGGRHRAVRHWPARRAARPAQQKP